MTASSWEEYSQGQWDKLSSHQEAKGLPEGGLSTLLLASAEAAGC